MNLLTRYSYNRYSFYEKNLYKADSQQCLSWSFFVSISVSDNETSKSELRDTFYSYFAKQNIHTNNE